MQRLGVLSVLFLFSACELFTSKEQTKQQIVQQEIQNINWNDVDKYPLFKNCDETAEKEDQKLCFQTTLTDYLYNALSQNQIVVNTNLQDTIAVTLIIRNDGSVALEEIEQTQTVAKHIPNIKELITNALQNLPQIYPAVKRGVQVSTKVKLPIVLQAN
jgi:hypothetical protein